MSVAYFTGVYPARPVAPGDGTGVKFFGKDSAADLTGVAPGDGTGVYRACPVGRLSYWG